VLERCRQLCPEIAILRFHFQQLPDKPRTLFLPHRQPDLTRRLRWLSRSREILRLRRVQGNSTDGER
jgi:hypothetical protein